MIQLFSPIILGVQYRLYDTVLCLSHLQSVLLTGISNFPPDAMYHPDDTLLNDTLHPDDTQQYIAISSVSHG